MMASPPGTSHSLQNVNAGQFYGQSQPVATASADVKKQTRKVLSHKDKQQPSHVVETKR